MSDAQSRGGQEALRALRLEQLAGRPINEIFVGLADYICPEGGSIDEGIARGAFMDTIVDLSEAGVTDLDSLSAAQVQTVFELYAANAIEGRICNDIGMKVISMPKSAHDAQLVQAQLGDFIRRGVSDALTRAGFQPQGLDPKQILSLVESVYESAFQIMQSIGESEGDL